MALAFLLAATTAAFRPARAEPTRSAEHTSKHPSLVTFTLVRGGRAAADYGLFTSSRQCLRDAIGDAVDYDDVAFHEGNVPLGIQMTLHLEIYHLRFVDAREQGGFDNAAGAYVQAHGSRLQQYSLGYHHMCHFMSMLWFRALGAYEYAMRVDEDVCIERLSAAALYRALAVDYAFGLETHEAHEETLQTFGPWVRGYMAEARLQPTLPPLPTSRIFFTNFFVSRIAWWDAPAVQQFLDAANASGGIYRHRWGDAPLQTAAVRLHASPASVLTSTWTMCTCQLATASSEARRCRSPPRASLTSTFDGWRPW